jgi:hypothetical protein
MTTLVSDGFESGGAGTATAGTYQNCAVTTAAHHSGTHALYVPRDPAAAYSYSFTFPSTNLLGVQIFVEPDSGYDVFTLSDGTGVVVTVSVTASSVFAVITGGNTLTLSGVTYSGFLQIDLLYDKLFGLLHMQAGTNAKSASVALPSSPRTPTKVVIGTFGAASATVSHSLVQDQGSTGITITSNSWSNGTFSVAWNDPLNTGEDYIQTPYGTVGSTFAGVTSANISGTPISGTWNAYIYNGEFVNNGGGNINSYAEYAFTFTPQGGMYVDDLTISDRATVPTAYSLAATTLTETLSPSGAEGKITHLAAPLLTETLAAAGGYARGYAVGGTLLTSTLISSGAEVYYGVRGGSIAETLGPSGQRGIAKAAPLQLTAAPSVGLAQIFGRKASLQLAAVPTLMRGLSKGGLLTATLTPTGNEAHLEVVPTIGETLSPAGSVHLIRNPGSVAVAERLSPSSSGAVYHGVRSGTIAEALVCTGVIGLHARASDTITATDKQVTTNSTPPQARTIGFAQGALVLSLQAGAS